MLGSYKAFVFVYAVYLNSKFLQQRWKTTSSSLKVQDKELPANEALDQSHVQFVHFFEHGMLRVEVLGVFASVRLWRLLLLLHTSP